MPKLVLIMVFCLACVGGPLAQACNSDADCGGWVCDMRAGLDTCHDPCGTWFQQPYPACHSEPSGLASVSAFGKSGSADDSFSSCVQVYGKAECEALLRE